MEDLIVIILTLIIAAAGALGQIRKRRQMAEENGEQKESESLWDLFQDEKEFGEKGIIQNYAEPRYNPMDEVMTESPIYPEREEKETEYEHKDVFERGRTIIKEEKEEEILMKDKIKSHIRDEFSLRKAVIYSEILNRKYT